jgi:hypothetical protein
MQLSGRDVYSTQSGLKELSPAELSMVFGGGTAYATDGTTGAKVALSTDMIVDYGGKNETLGTVLANVECGVDFGAVLASDGSIGILDGTELVLDCSEAGVDDYNLAEPLIDDTLTDIVNDIDTSVTDFTNDLDSLMWSGTGYDPTTGEYQDPSLDAPSSN